jgi:hypothetical protein
MGRVTESGVESRRSSADGRLFLGASLMPAAEGIAPADGVGAILRYTVP